MQDSEPALIMQVSKLIFICSIWGNWAALIDSEFTASFCRFHVEQPAGDGDHNNSNTSWCR